MKFAQRKKFILQLQCGLFVACLLLLPGLGMAAIKIVAAENFYGQIAKELGGNNVQVINILENPQQDPHLYSATPSISRAIADADVVIYNGLSYDPWMDKLLSVSSNKLRQVIQVADLRTDKSQNPHIWYDPKTISAFAKLLAAQLSQLDPPHAQEYQDKLAQFMLRQQQLLEYIQHLKPQIQGQSIAATEPLFNLMAIQLGLVIRDQSFQQQAANEGEPTAAAVQGLLNDLQQRTVRALIYNQQVTSPLLDNIKKIAQQHNVAIIGMTETLPSGLDYQTWMRQQLTELAQALTHVP